MPTEAEPIQYPILQAVTPSITRILLIALLTAHAPSLEALQAQEDDGSILIRNVTVISVLGDQRLRDVNVILRDGLIQSISPTNADLTDFPGRVIEGERRFLIPGLIDAHVHVSGSPRSESEPLLKWALEGGVTSIRDMAGDARSMAGLKRALLVGEIAGPSVYYSALMAGPPFMSDPRLDQATIGYERGTAPYMIPITPDTDIGHVVAMAKGTGATGIKLYAALDEAIIRAVTTEAHQIGLQVWAHSAIFPARPVEILDAGIDGVSHAPYVIWEAEPATDDFNLRALGDFSRISPDGPEMGRVIEAMIRNATVLDPTLFVFNRGLNDQVAQQRLDWGAAFTRRAHQAGVPISAGTDGIGRPIAGTMPNMHTEMELLVSLAGFSPHDALRAGTWGGAMAIGIADRTGTVEVGKEADLVLLSADPTDDIRNTRKIVRVIQGGKVVR